MWCNLWWILEQENRADDGHGFEPILDGSLCLTSVFYSPSICQKRVTRLRGRFLSEENRFRRFLIHIWFDSIIMTLAHGNPELLESKQFLRLRSQHSNKVNASEWFSISTVLLQKVRSVEQCVWTRTRSQSDWTKGYCVCVSLHIAAQPWSDAPRTSWQAGECRIWGYATHTSDHVGRQGVALRMTEFSTQLCLACAGIRHLHRWGEKEVRWEAQWRQSGGSHHRLSEGVCKEGHSQGARKEVRP